MAQANANRGVYTAGWALVSSQGVEMIRRLLASCFVAVLLLTGSDAIAAPTGGSGGSLTDSTNLQYRDAQGVTSRYHLYAAGLDWSRPVGLIIYADGSGEYGLKNARSSYLLAGTERVGQRRQEKQHDPADTARPRSRLQRRRNLLVCDVVRLHAHRQGQMVVRAHEVCPVPVRHRRRPSGFRRLLVRRAMDHPVLRPAARGPGHDGWRRGRDLLWRSPGRRVELPGRIQGQRRVLLGLRRK